MSVAQEATLTELVEDYRALLDTEALVPESQREAFKKELILQFQRLESKRDAVGHFIRKRENQVKTLRKDIQRLQKRIKRFQRQADGLRGIAYDAIRAVGQDQDGHYRLLEGDSFTFYLRENAPDAVINAEWAIPDEYKDVEITLPLTIWQKLFRFCEQNPALLSALVEAGAAKKTSVDKTRVKVDLKAGKDVPGARLDRSVSLVMR